jgi:hypothetical protein
VTEDDLSRLLQAHRSVRKFEDRPVDRSLVDRVLVDALHGSSSSGNLNMVSVIKTFDVERKKRLCELHFEQPMLLQAPLVLTFCATATARGNGWHSALRDSDLATSSAGR